METKKYRGGAPRKADAQKCNRRVEVLFTDDEFTQVSKRKGTTKSMDLSAFIRDVCLNKPIPVKPQLSTQQEKVLALLYEMRQDILRIGVNVNQSAKRINSTTDYQDLRDEIGSITEQVNQLNDQLLAIASATQLGDLRDTRVNDSANGSSN